MTRQFGALTASELYCPKCKRSQKVRERLLLVLPSGELYEFVCTTCGSSLANRTVTGPTVTGADLLPNRASGPLTRRLLR